MGGLAPRAAAGRLTMFSAGWVLLTLAGRRSHRHRHRRRRGPRNRPVPRSAGRAVPGQRHAEGRGPATARSGREVVLSSHIRSKTGQEAARPGPATPSLQQECPVTTPTRLHRAGERGRRLRAAPQQRRCLGRISSLVSDLPSSILGGAWIGVFGPLNDEPGVAPRSRPAIGPSGRTPDRAAAAPAPQDHGPARAAVRVRPLRRAQRRRPRPRGGNGSARRRRTAPLHLATSTGNVTFSSHVQSRPRGPQRPSLRRLRHALADERSSQTMHVSQRRVVRGSVLAFRARASPTAS